MRKFARALHAFTLIELLTVMAVMVTLAGMVLMSVSYAQKKAASSRAESEIIMLSSGCLNYKTDQGVYPTPMTQLVGSGSSNVNPTVPLYLTSSRALYQALSGDGDDALKNGSIASSGTITEGAVQYVEFKTKMLGGLDSNLKATGTAYIKDPFGNPYGYYAPDATDISTYPQVFNPTFDLWSTAGSTTATGTNSWIKNW